MLKLAALRCARAAGDEGKYQRLLYGGDGRSPAELEAADRAQEAALPAWAAWRQQQQQTEREALQAAADDLENVAAEQVWEAESASCLDLYADVDALVL